MESILFFIKRKKLLKDGTAPIYLRVTVKKQASEVAMKKSIVPSSWVAIKGRAKGNTLKNKQINNFLDQQEYILHDISLNLQKEGKEVSAKEILKRYKGKDETNLSILQLYEEHNQQLKSLIGISVAKNTYKRHETSLKLFKEFLSFKYKKQDILAKEIDVSLLEEYRHYLMTVRHNNNNTTVKYLRNIGKVLQTAIVKGAITTSPLQKLQLRIEEVEKEYLTKEELDKLIKTQFEIERLEQVKNIFLFCSFTGLAYIDVFSLTNRDLINNSGELWIKKARTKTSSMCHIPVLSPALSILEKYNYRSKKDGEKLLPVLSNQKMNAYLKEIANLCGIKKNLTTHLARHSFGTLLLSAGISIESIAKMMGHANISSTQGYAQVTDDKISEDMDRLMERRKTMQNNATQTTAP